MTRWEYRILVWTGLYVSPMTDEEAGAALTELGRQGWELAASASGGAVLIFKRPLKS